MMPVDIRKRIDADEFICIIDIGGESIEIVGGQPYRSRQAAIDGLVMMHAIMHICMIDMVSGRPVDPKSGVEFVNTDGNTKWSVSSGDKVIARCSNSFKSAKSAIENFSMVYVKMSILMASIVVESVVE